MPGIKSIQQWSRSTSAQRFVPFLFPLALLVLILLAPPTALRASSLVNSSSSEIAQASSFDSNEPSHDPYNVYLLKIPKVGGTTLAILLQTYAKDYHLQIASPGVARTIQTCQGREGALKAWNEVRDRSPTKKFDIFMSHGCYKPFMQASKQPEVWNKPDRQLRLTMFREPWSRVVSFYRYVSKCCESNPPLEWCAFQCSWAATPDRFFKHNCIDSMNCNQLYYYLRAQYPDDSLVLSRADADAILKDFDFIVILEMLEESLVLLHLRYGIPFKLLPHINANANKGKLPRISDKIRTASMARMQPDVVLYEAARDRLRREIEALPDRKLFEDKLARLREVQVRVSQLCADRWGRCLTSDPGLVSDGSCYYECVQAVSNDQPVPPVPFCAECKRFRKGCMVCTCNTNGGADCIPNKGSCLPLTLTHKCVGEAGGESA